MAEDHLQDICGYKTSYTFLWSPYKRTTLKDILIVFPVRRPSMGFPLFDSTEILWKITEYYFVNFTLGVFSLQQYFEKRGF